MRNKRRQNPRENPAAAKLYSAKNPFCQKKKRPVCRNFAGNLCGLKIEGFCWECSGGFCLGISHKNEKQKATKSVRTNRKIPSAPQTNLSAESCGGFVLSQNFPGFCLGIFWRIFGLGMFPQNRETKGDKIREKIRWLQKSNPRKIPSAQKRTLSIMYGSVFLCGLKFVGQRDVWKDMQSKEILKKELTLQSLLVIDERCIAPSSWTMQRMGFQPQQCAMAAHAALEWKRESSE